MIGARRFSGRRAARGFTLLEVMIALALLGLALTVLIKSVAGDIYSAQQARMIGVATDLQRAKMYEIEEKLIKDGFSDTEQGEDDQAFEAEGWPELRYSYKVEEVELPSWDKLQAIAAGRGCQSAPGSTSGSGAGAESSGSGAGSQDCGFQDSALGGMLSMFGGGGLGGTPSGGSGKGSGDIESAVGASFIQGQYQMFQQILKVTIRKATVTVKWNVMGTEQEMKFVQFFTDPSAMDKVIQGMGANELPTDTGSGPPGGGPGGGKGSGSGKGSGK